MGTFNGAGIGSPSYASAASGFGECVALNGTSQSVAVPLTALEFGPTDSWTLEFRLKTTTSVGVNGISVMLSQYTDSSHNFWLGVQSGTFCVAIPGFGGGLVDTTVNVADGAWHDVAVAMSSGTSLKIFVDGVLKNTVSGTWLGSGNGAGAGGAIGQFSFETPYWYNGSIDEVAIYDAAIYTATYTPATAPISDAAASLRALYHLDGDATDSKASPLYSEVDAVSPAFAQNIMVLVPGATSNAPYNAANPTPLVIYCHGAGEDCRALLTDSLKTACVEAFLTAGYLMAGTDAHGQESWGNSASVADYADLYNYCKQNYNISHVLLWSQSMGGLDGLLSLAQNKIPGVVGWLGTYPVCSLASLYALGTYTASINAAFGITGSGTATYGNMTYGSDPALKWGNAFRSVPMRFYASPSDATAPKAQNSDVLAALVQGSTREAVVVACTGQHGDPSHFQPSDYVAFAQRCFATPVPSAGFGLDIVTALANVGITPQTPVAHPSDLKITLVGNS